MELRRTFGGGRKRPSGRRLLSRRIVKIAKNTIRKCAGTKILSRMFAYRVWLYYAGTPTTRLYDKRHYIKLDFQVYDKNAPGDMVDDIHGQVIGNCIQYKHLTVNISGCVYIVAAPNTRNPVILKNQTVSNSFTLYPDKYTNVMVRVALLQLRLPLPPSSPAYDDVADTQFFIDGYQSENYNRFDDLMYNSFNPRAVRVLDDQLFPLSILNCNGPTDTPNSFALKFSHVLNNKVILKHSPETNYIEPYNPKDIYILYVDYQPMLFRSNTDLPDNYSYEMDTRINYRYSYTDI